MTKVYLIRHAEAEGNIYRRAHGQYNGLVTLRGHKQIKLLRERFADEQIDAVYSSDLARAYTTSLSIAEPRGFEVVTAPQLREVKMGVWEDVSWGELEYGDNEMNVMFNSDPSKWQVKGSETFEQVEERISGYIAEIAANHDGGTIAVFSHGFAIRTFICHIQGIPPSETATVPYYDNTAVTLLTFDNGVFSVDYAGDNTHLHGGNSTLEKQSWWRSETARRPENLRYFPLPEVAGENLLRIFKAKAGERAIVDTQYAAYLVDEPVGILGLDTYREANRGIGWISYVHVVPQHRLHTFGTQLIGLAVSDFRKLRREKLRIELPSGSPGINFMGKCGFSVMLTTETLCQMEKYIRNW